MTHSEDPTVEEDEALHRRFRELAELATPAPPFEAVWDAAERRAAARRRRRRSALAALAVAAVVLLALALRRPASRPPLRRARIATSTAFLLAPPAPLAIDVDRGVRPDRYRLARVLAVASTGAEP